MNEWLIILVISLTSILFAAGGTDIPKIGGQKWLRRYLIPIFLGGVSLLNAPWWAALGFTATIAFFLTLGYGSKAKWPYRAFIFAGYGLSSLWFGWSWWAIVTPVTISMLFLASNWKPIATSFVWKICELSMGFLIGCSYVGSIINKWFH